MATCVGDELVTVDPARLVVLVVAIGMVVGCSDEVVYTVPLWVTT